MESFRETRLKALKLARQRRWKHRIKNHLACTTVEYDGEVLDLLVRLGWLREQDASSPKAVGRAVTALLRQSARVRGLPSPRNQA